MTNLTFRAAMRFVWNELAGRTDIVMSLEFIFKPLLLLPQKMVGAVRFELTTSCTRNKRATRLRYAPTQGRKKVPGLGPKCNVEFQKIRQPHVFSSRINHMATPNPVLFVTTTPARAYPSLKHAAVTAD
jgi:hypothetical protein